MNSFFLCLNTSKTKILVFIPPSLKDTIKIEGSFINNNCIRFVQSANNLGVILDNELSFNSHVNKVVQSCFSIIRRLSKIKAYLTAKQLQVAISALIFSKLDYCNSLYFGSNTLLLKKLQSVQNAAARLLLGRNQRIRCISDFIRNHHWLKIKERIVFKISTIVHKCMYGSAPHAIKNLLTNVHSRRHTMLEQYKPNTNYGKRCFRRVAPKIWNTLPENLRCERNVERFKGLLKTYLFDNFQNIEHILSQ